MRDTCVTADPGRRGEAEWDDDVPFFVETSGFGVCLPAEVYDELVRRARLADELGA